MRDVFRTTITQPQADGTLKALAGIEITVMLVDTTTLATIYQRRTGAAQGPAPESAGSGGPNPFTTAVSGAVEFWLPAGVYDIHIRDTQAPARVATRGNNSGTPPIQWNSMPASAGALPTTILSGDAGITLSSLGPDVLRQSLQIGQVFDWWRPSSAVPLPAGCEICDGHQVTQHDFIGVAGAINLPDLRNKFIIGADVLKADGSGSVNGDGTAAPTAQHPNAPGIGGTGGSNASKNFAHTHGIPNHSHQTDGQGSHTHGGTTYGENSSLSHGHIFNLPAPGRAAGSSSWGNSQTGSSGISAAASTFGTITDVNGVMSNGPGGHSHTFVTDTQGYHTHTAGAGADASTNPQTVNQTWTANPGTDMRPQHVGLLKLMKVRRA